MQLSKPRIVIIGAGFAGLKLAKNLKNSKFDVVLIDKNNHHLFQPLLYQVATAALSPADIAMPIRTELRRYKNVQVIMSEVISIDKENKKLICNDGILTYDYLVVASGSRHSYFGHQEWEKYAPGIKNLKDALYMREKILCSFEKAERNYQSPDRQKYTTFVVVGGGPTGVELAGAIAEISRKTMLEDFPILKSSDIKVILVDAGNKLLSAFPDKLSKYTKEALEDLGVEIRFNTFVQDVNEKGVKTNEGFIKSNCIIWAAGNEASPILKTLDSELDNVGRVKVNEYLAAPHCRDVYVIGDSALFLDEKGQSLPGIAPVAMQQGLYLANYFKSNLSSQKPFAYTDKGIMATIGKAKAVAKISNIEFTGFFAWMAWGLLHIFFLIDFKNRIKVMLEWLWYYLTFKSSARLIMHKMEENEKAEVNEER